MRAREVAKKDQLRARHRLHKFLLRRGLQPLEKIKTWTARHLDWVKTLRLEQPAQAATLLDYITEVEHAVQRIKRLECAIDQAVDAAPASIRAVIDGLQALRGVARISAATLVAELGQLSRFPRPKQLMGYTGAVPREHSSGAQVRRGAITKTGNAHLRRILVEAAWSYRHRPSLGGELLRRQKNASEEVREIAWKAQHRLHSRYARLAARGKLKQHIVTAVARELAGFVWAIGVEVERQIAGQRTRAA
jgi:transposase